MDDKKYAKLCLNENASLFVNHKSSEAHHNNSYDHENNK